MAEKLPKHKIVEYLFQCYNEFKEYSEREGIYFIEYQGYTISYLDLQNQLQKISARKRQAMELCLVLGYRQTEAAQIMGVTSVTVGQYIKAGTTKLSEAILGDGDNEG